MAKYLTTNTLIDSVTRRAMLPETQVTFKEEDFLAFANEEMDLGVVPHILMFHEDYLLTHVEVELELDKKRYEIPEDANGAKLRDICFIDVSGNIYEMTRIMVEDVSFYQENTYNGVVVGLRPFLIEGSDIVLMPSNDNSLLSAGGKLRIYYYKRPNEIVSEDRVSLVKSVDKQKGIVTVDKVSSVISDGDELDITSSKNPHKLIANRIIPNDIATEDNLTFTFGTKKIVSLQVSAPSTGDYIKLTDNTSKTEAVRIFWFDLTGTDTAPVVTGATNYSRINVSDSPSLSVLANRIAASISNLAPVIVATSSSNTVTISNGGNGVCVGDNFEVENFGVISLVQNGTNTLPQYIHKNDVIALTGETIIPQVPQELHSMLAHRVAMRCLEALNDASGYSVAATKLQEMETKSASILDNRVEGSPKKVVNRHSHLRYSRRVYRR